MPFYSDETRFYRVILNTREKEDFLKGIYKILHEKQNLNKPPVSGSPISWLMTYIQPYICQIKKEVLAEQSTH